MKDVKSRRMSNNQRGFLIIVEKSCREIEDSNTNRARHYAYFQSCFSKQIVLKEKKC